MNARTKRFVSHLRTCIEAGKEALESSQESRDQLQDLLREYVEAVQSIELERDEEDNESVRSALREFDEHLSDLENAITDLQRGFAMEVDQSFQSLQEASEYVTVTLFGRTKAGKSTLMETLTEGDGSTIGEGAQHETTDVRPDHFWPPGQELLRIVDTPGVEGFEGEEMTEKANKFVERSDLIIFLVTDDKVSAGELDHFGNISTFGKPIVILLNVKEKYNNVVVEEPGYVFEEIGGHKRRMERYLSENFGIKETEVVPFHAKGAWESTQTSNEKLRDASRIGEVKKRIKDFVEEEGLAARISAPRDVLRSYVGTIKDDLRPFAGKFRSLSWSAKDLQEKMDSALEQVDIFGKRRLSDMKSVFEEASADIPQFVDSIIRDGKSGRVINAKWESFLKEHGIHEIESGFRSEVVDQIEKEISRSADRARRASDSKFQGDDVDGVSSAFEDIQEIEGRKKTRRHGKAAMKAGGGIAGGAAAYAAANFWNPTGWAAGAAAAATVAAGYAGERAGNYAAEKWQEKTEERIKEKRDEIVDDLRDRLWSTYHSLNDELYEWLQEVQGELRSDLRKTLSRLESVSGSLWRRTVQMLYDLDDYARSLGRRRARQCMRAEIPGVEDGQIRLERAAITSDVGARLLVSSDSDANPLSACIGSGGKRAKQVSRRLGVNPVVFIDGGSSIEEKISQALYSVDVRSIDVLTNGEKKKAEVEVPGPQVGRAIGREGKNIIQVEDVLGFDKINISEV